MEEKKEKVQPAEDKNDAIQPMTDKKAAVQPFEDEVLEDASGGLNILLLDGPNP